MNDASLAFSEVFGFDVKALPRDSLIGLEPGENAASLKNALARLAVGIEWTTVSGDVTRSVEALLNISMKDVLVGAWDKYRALREHLDRHKTSPGEIIVFPLAEHTIHSEHRPFIEILVNEQVIARVDFEVDIALNFKGANLKIQDGKIIEIRTGSCQGSCTVTCQGGVIFQKDSSTVHLPGSIDLGEGIAIGAAGVDQGSVKR
jgi:hypothetical protein